MKDINWAVLGTGVIANEMAVALKKNGKNIYAVGNRTYEKAVAFGEKYGIGKVYADYNEMFTDPEVDVIYITTPHNTHKKFMRQAIENGKHILVEKSITLNSDELNEMAALAEEKHVIIGEAMTIYHMPIYKKLKELYEKKDFKTLRTEKEKIIELEIIKELYNTNSLARSITDNPSEYLKTLNSMNALTKDYTNLINRMQNILEQYIEITNK